MLKRLAIQHHSDCVVLFFADTTLTIGDSPPTSDASTARRKTAVHWRSVSLFGTSSTLELAGRSTVTGSRSTSSVSRAVYTSTSSGTTRPWPRTAATSSPGSASTAPSFRSRAAFTTRPLTSPRCLPNWPITRSVDWRWSTVSISLSSATPLICHSIERKNSNCISRYSSAIICESFHWVNKRV